MDVPDGKPLSERELPPIDPLQEPPARPPAQPQGGEPPQPPGPRHVRHVVEIPAKPGSAR